MNVREELFRLQDLKYRDFHSALIPNIDKNELIGVRIPELRKLAKKLTDDNFQWEYYEEIMLHGFYIGYAKLSYNDRLELLKAFIPKINNWAVCDCVSSTFKFVNQNKSEFINFLKPYMNSKAEYELRFAVVMLMDYYLDDEYINFTVDYLSALKSEHYYVNMAIAWALSAAFIKNESIVMPLIKNAVLEPFVHNKTISKICDSYRVEKAVKEELKKYRIKKSD